MERLEDGEPEVAKAAIFALGTIPDEGSAGPLAALLVSSDPEIRGLGALAVGRAKLARARIDVERLLADPDLGVRGQALLSLGFLRQKESIPEIAKVLESADPDPELVWRAVYAIGRIGGEEAVGHLVRAASSPHVLARTFAAIYLERIGDAAGVGALARLVRDPDWRVAAGAARALGKFPGPESVTALSEAWRADAFDSGSSESFHRAAEAARSLFAIAGPDDPLPALEDGGDSRTFRRAFLGGVVATRDSSEGIGIAMDLLDPEATPEFDERDRRVLLDAAAEGLARRLLAGDDLARPAAGEFFRRAPDHARATLLAGLAPLPVGDDDPFFLALLGLSNPDVAVRGAAAELLRERGDLREIGHLAAAYADSLERAGHYEVREYLAVAAGAIDSPLAIELLERALEDPATSVRAAAAAGLEKRTGSPRKFSPAPAAYAPPPVDRHAYSAEGPRVEMVTEKGRIVIDLYPDEAPTHVDSFLTLVEKKFYDGLTIHRVVPAFVVQGGDPRGDGWGDAGFTLRDEIHWRHPFVRGTVGMPRAGRDTGGCQFFITHLPAPHLDWSYTAFGQVVQGLDVVDRLEVGDRILEARILGL